MLPVEHNDPINAKILAVSEDKIEGDFREPFEEIAARSGVPVETVMARITAMLEAGTIRRVRQTLLATNLAQGALVAWKIDDSLIANAFDFIAKHDPFSGHVVIRNGENGPSAWRLWTTLKVPAGFSVEKHCDYLRTQIGAQRYRIMPPPRPFVLGVGHMRRKGMQAGQKSERLAEAMIPAIVDLSERDWTVLVILKRDF